MEYTGKVKFIGEKEVIGDKKLEKMTIVLDEETDREFKWGLAVDFFGDKIALTEWIKLNDVITVYLNTRVSESKTQPGKYFNSISSWKVVKDKEETKEGTENEDLPF